MAQFNYFKPNPQGLPFTSIALMYCRTCGVEELHMTHQDKRKVTGEGEVSTTINRHTYFMCFDCFIEDV